MTNTFFAADHHFSHRKILEFTNLDGSKLRDFGSLEEMNYHIVQQHNKVVRSNDRVYFLGDVTLTKNLETLDIVSRMNGIKTLILGNHDIHSMETYAKYFKAIKAIHVMDGFVLTHVPIHPVSIGRWGINIHGHLHSNKIMDPSYFCVSMEQLDDYTPISLEQIKAKLKPKIWPPTGE